MCELILLEKIEKVQKYKVTLPLDLLLCYLIGIRHRLFTILEIFVILQFRSNYFIHWVRLYTWHSFHSIPRRSH